MLPEEAYFSVQETLTSPLLTGPHSVQLFVRIPQRAIYTIQGKGVDIVIAHPERYKPVQEDIDVAREMREMGCRLQLSANFVEGGIFNPRRRTATALLKNGLVDYLASDAHRVEHYATYLKALKEAQKY